LEIVGKALLFQARSGKAIPGNNGEITVRRSKSIARRGIRMKPLPILNAAAFFLLAVILSYWIGGGMQAYAVGTVDKIDGTVIAGSIDNRISISITNPSANTPIEGVALEVFEKGRWISNIRIQADESGPLAPKSTRRFTVVFDISPDAEGDAVDKVTLVVTAKGALVDHPNPAFVVKIQKPKGSDEAETLQQPVLKLVKITGPPPIDPVTKKGARYDYTENQSGYTAITQRFGKDHSVFGVAVTYAPLEIIPGKPFHIEVEVRQRVFEEFQPDCTQNNIRSAKANPKWISQGSAGAGSFSPGVSIGAGSFKGWARSKDPLGCGDGIVKLKLYLIPEKPEYKDVFKKTFYDYSWKVESEGRDSGGTNSMGYGGEGKARLLFRYPDEYFFKLDIEITPHEYSSFLWSLKLQYRPPEPGQTAIASLPPFEFPPELTQPAAQGVGGTQVVSGEEIGNDVPEGDGSDREGTFEPNRLDPNRKDVSAKIREWISAAEPPENVTEGARFRYDPWGRKIGTTADGGIIRATSKPAYAQSTPEKTVWSMRKELDSVNHCTLEEYVVAKLQNQSIDSCQGRYKAPAAATVAKLTGLPLAEAKEKLEQAGLKPKLVAGKPASSKRDEGTIVSQNPAPGTKLRPGTSVTLEVYGPYNPNVTIPDVAKLSVNEAKARLEAKGLKARLIALGPAPSNGLSFKVKEAEPKSGVKVAPGTEVKVKVYGKYSPPLVAVPRVGGLSFSKAKDVLTRAGLKVSPKSAGAAPSEGQSAKVKSQEPGVGAKVTPGSEVKVYVFSKYVPPDSTIHEEITGQTETIAVGAWRMVGRTGPKVTSQPGCRRPVFQGNTVHYLTEPDYGYWDFSFTWKDPPPVIEPNKEYSIQITSQARRRGRPTGEAGVGARIGIAVDGIRGNVLKCFANGKEARPDYFAWSGFQSTANGVAKLILGTNDPDQFKISLWITDGGCSAALIGEYTYRRGPSTGPGPINVERADSVNFIGSFRLSDPTRSSAKYRGTVNFRAGGTFTSVEYVDGKRRTGKGKWSFNQARRTFIIDWQPGGRFEGNVSGNTHDFVIAGRWAEGNSGKLRINK